MATAAEAAASHYRQQQALAAEVARAAQRSWRQINAADIAASWRLLSQVLLRTLIAGQQVAAGSAPPYVAAVLAAAGLAHEPVARLDPSAFAGAAADGRDLGTLLTTPLIYVFQDLEHGMTADTALLRGQNRLVQIVTTEVRDAGRLADQTVMASDSTVTRYIRHVNLPACARCIILAGRVYRYSTGFLRHPKCDCTMIPEVEDLGPQDPADLIQQMRDQYPAGDHSLSKSLTQGDLAALDHGADLNQVVNAHRGMATAAGPAWRRTRVTREGTTRRGVAGQRLSGRPRLTPAQIFDLASRDGWSRQQVIAQLMRAGYLF